MRCGNPNNPNYSTVKVCDEWLTDYTVFRDWALTNGWKPLLQIDRYPDKNGNYEPSNCRFVTPKENMRNRNCTIEVLYQGKMVKLADMADYLRINYDTLYHRLFTHGWTIEEAIAGKRTINER